MTNADLLAEAVHTAITLGWALAAWIAVLAALGTALLLGATAAVYATYRAVQRRLRRHAGARDRGEYGRAA